MEPITLQFDLPSMTDQKVTDRRMSSISLHEKSLEYTLQMTCDERDEELGMWKNDIEQDDQVMFLKSAVIGVSHAWDHDESLWKMLVCIQGVKNIFFWFNDELDCKVVANKIKDWLLV